MKVDKLELIESSVSHKLIVNSNDDVSYSFNERSGVFKRKYGEAVETESYESGSIQDEKKKITMVTGLPGLKNRGDPKEFIPSVVLRDNDSLITYLGKADLYEWEIVVKNLDQRKSLIRNKERFKKSFFHNSILVRIRDNKYENFIEIGEGNKKGEKFNQGGLKNRLEEVIRCNRDGKNLSFKEDVPVILSPGDGGIIFHEILGHSLEADHIYNGVSPFSTGDIGEKVVSENLTITMSDRRDDFFRDTVCDDEGERPVSKYLVKNGVIKSVISDTYYGNLLKIKHRGFSRQEDFSRVPIPRMFSIYISPGKYEPGELLSSVKFGIYAKEFGEGKVLFNQNLFYFNINSAYIIRNGKISEPLGRVIVKGEIDKTLNSVEMIASDFQYDRGISYCLKDGQFLNVRIGQPTVKIGALTITGGSNGR